MISKSKYLAGLQCSKLLWHLHNAPSARPATDAATQAVFDQGAEVGRLARTLHPDGILINHDADPEQAITDTQAALDQRRPIFEAAFRFNGASCRVDIMIPAGDDQWDLVEVKSTTGVKDVHLHDLAFQAHVLAGAEVKLRRCILMHLNSDYVRHGDLYPARLFERANVTPQVRALTRGIEDRLDDLARVNRQPASPEVDIGKHCDDPYPCPLKDRCWSFLPDHSIFDLCRGGERSHQLFRQGVHSIHEIPDDVALTDRQAIQIASLRSGQTHVDRPAIRAFLERIKYPAHFLDFETINPAIPVYDGTSPYGQTPFQFSLHVQATPDADPVHHSFLADGSADPRRALMDALCGLIEPNGSVVAYNASFELRVLRECCVLLPEFRPWLESVEPRIVDLLEPFRKFHYYHRDQRGSASMKRVLPALTGQGYEGLEIGDGGMASREFLRVTFGDVDPADRERVRRDLETYCALDTSGMVDILGTLRGLTT